MFNDEFDPDAEHPDAPRRHRRRESGSTLLAMTLVVVLFGILGFGGWWAYNNVVKEYFTVADYEGDGNGTSVAVEVLSGQTVAQIANMLQEEGVVASARAFVNASSDNDDLGTQIQPGVYELQEEMSAEAALRHLANSENRLVNAVTIPEGRSSFQIYEILSNHTGVPVEEFEEAAKDPVGLGVAEFWFDSFDKQDFEVRQIVSVEGFLFPATYEFDEDMSAEQMLKAMVAKFNQVMEDINFVDTVRNELQLEPWQALQIASIIQKESGHPDDDPKIARVLYNRLYLNWVDHAQTNCYCLGSEAIFNYGREFEGLEPITSGEPVNWTELMHDADNPWAASARENEGYMITPISSPGIEALKGAMNPSPAENTWLFFVTAYEEDGKLLALFADTYEEHRANTKVAEDNGIQ
jgi:UPF0755 protein